MAEWEDQHQNAENLRADQLLTKELRRLEIRRASGQDPPNQGAAKGGEESWIPPVKIDLVKEMFHDLERRREYMDERCQKHSRVFDTPPTGRTRNGRPERH